MEKKKTVSFVMIAVQIALFIFALAIIIALCLYYYRVSLRDIREEKSNLLSMYAREANARITLDIQQIQETFWTIVDMNGLWGEELWSKYVDKLQARDLIQEKADTYRDLEYLFAYREGDFLISGTADNTQEKLKLMDFIRENVSSLSTTPSQNRWIISYVDGETYSFLVYYHVDARLYVGAAISCETLFDSFYQAAEDQSVFIKITDAGGTYWTTSGYIQESYTGEELPETSVGGQMTISGYFEPVFLEIWRQNILAIFILIGLLCIAMIILQSRLLDRLVLRSVKILANEVKDAREDLKHIKVNVDSRIWEVYDLQSTLKYLLEQIVSAQMALYEKKVSEQDMELRQLRAQLRPHFYLNAITTVSNMTYHDGGAAIREYLGYLSDYMRYMMKIQTTMVSLRSELEHINNYVKLQNIRFKDSCILMTECDKALEDKEIPYLFIYTAVENAFKYAMKLSEPLIIFIRCQLYKDNDFDGYRVIIEDNGDGFTQDQIERYNADTLTVSEDGNHIGLSNIKRSLWLIYRKKGLMWVGRAIPSGAVVELRIPFKGGQENVEGINC